MIGCGEEKTLYESKELPVETSAGEAATSKKDNTQNVDNQAVSKKESETQTTSLQTKPVETETMVKDTTLSYPLEYDAVLDAYKNFAVNNWGIIDSIPYVLISVNDAAIPICIVTVSDYFPTALAIENGQVVTIEANECYNLEYYYNTAENKLTVHGVNGSFVDDVCYHIDENGFAKKFIAIQKADWGENQITYADFLSGTGVEIDAATYEEYKSQIGDTGEWIFPDANGNKLIDIDKK